MLPLTQPTAEFSVLQTWGWLASSGQAHCYSTAVPLRPLFSPSSAAAGSSLSMQSAATPAGVSMFPGVLEALSLAGVGRGHSSLGSCLWIWLPWAEPFAPLVPPHSCPQTQQRKILLSVPLGSLHVHPLESRSAGREGSGKPTAHPVCVWLFCLELGDLSFGLHEALCRLFHFLRFPISKAKH